MPCGLMKGAIQTTIAGPGSPNPSVFSHWAGRAVPCGLMKGAIQTTSAGPGSPNPSVFSFVTYWPGPIAAYTVRPVYIK